MTRIRVKVMIACALVAVLGSALPAEAAKLAKPSAPTIVLVKKVATSGTLGNFQVTIEQTSDASKSRITTEIKLGATICKIKSPATSCTLKKVKLRNYIALRARSTNKSGTSKWSQIVRLQPSSTGYVRAGYDATGKKFPTAYLSTTYKWKTLGTGSKWTKFQPLRRSSVSSASFRPYRAPRVVTCNSASPTTSTPGQTGETCVAFNVNGIVGLAQATSQSSCGSNVSCALAVNPDGTTSSLFISGSDTPQVKDFYAAPNGKMFVVFQFPVRLVVGGPNCVFVQVDADTGIPTCIDPDMMNIQTSFGNMYGLSNNGNPPVQFDDAGNVYYMGGVQGLGYTTALREYSNGTIRNIIADNVNVSDFIVTSDGKVIISGTTSSTQAKWVRRINPTGQIKNLLTLAFPSWMRQFGDGNIYMGVPIISGAPKIVRYLKATDEMDTLPWIMSSVWARDITTPQSTFDGYQVCNMTGSTSNAFCQYSGTYALNIFNIGTTRSLAVCTIPGGVGGNSQLVQFWPTLEMETTIISNVTIAYRVKNSLILTGTNAAGKNILTIYDPETNQEQIILDGSDEVEIYSVAYVPATNKLMFNGLRFSDGKYVVSEVAVP